MQKIVNNCNGLSWSLLQIGLNYSYSGSGERVRVGYNYALISVYSYIILYAAS